MIIAYIKRLRKTSNKKFNFMPQGTIENENTHLTFSRRNETTEK